MAEHTKSRKPIYDEPEPSTPTPSLPAVTPRQPPSTTPTLIDRLAPHVRSVRLGLHSQVARAEDGFNSTLDRAFALEHSFTSTVASLHPARSTGETILPGAVYVLVAAMGASVFARGSNFLIRATLPLAVGLGTANYVLPVTTRNVGQLAWKWEKKFPVVADTHAKTQERISKFVTTGIEHSKMGGEMLKERVKGMREGVEDWVKKGK